MKNIIQLTNENKKLKAELETFKKTYGSHPQIDDRFLKGGFRVVCSIEERDAINCCFRKQGMVVLVVSEHLTFKQYVLTSDDPCKNEWEEVKTGGGGEIPPLDYVPLVGTEEGKELTDSIVVERKIETSEDYMNLTKPFMYPKPLIQGDVEIYSFFPVGIYENNDNLGGLTFQYTQSEPLPHNMAMLYSGSMLNNDVTAVIIGKGLPYEHYSYENPESGETLDPTRNSVLILSSKESYGLVGQHDYRDYYIPNSFVQKAWVEDYVVGQVPTKTSDLVNDGEDGEDPYAKQSEIPYDYIYTSGVTIIDDNSSSGWGFQTEGDIGVEILNGAFKFYNSSTDITINNGSIVLNSNIISHYGTQFSTSGSLISGDKVKTPKVELDQVSTTLSTLRTIYTDGVNVKYVGNDGISKDLAFASDIKTGIFNPPTLAQLTALNIKRGDFYKNINTGQIALFDGEQLTEWIITSVTQWNSLTPEQKAAVKIFSYQKDE